MPEPHIHNDGSGLWFTFPFASDVSGGQIGGQIELTERQERILELLRGKPALNRKELALLLGINEFAVQKHLNALKQKGVLVRIGGTRGYWQVTL